MTKRERELRAAGRSMARTLIKLESMVREEDNASGEDAAWSGAIRPIVKRALRGRRWLAR